MAVIRDGCGTAEDSVLPFSTPSTPPTRLAARQARRRSRIARRGAVAGLILTSVVGSMLVLAPASAAERPVVSDTFDRAATDGWGAPTGGGALYRTSGTSAGVLSVAEAAAQIDLSSGDGANVKFAGATSGDTRAQASISLNTVGGSAYYAFVVRAQADGSAYRARLNVNSGGVPFLSVSRLNHKTETALTTIKLPQALSAGKWYELAFTVTGTDPVRIEGSLTPADAAGGAPQLVFEDSAEGRIGQSGGLGFWAYGSRQTTGTTALSLDDLVITDNVAPLSGPEAPQPTPKPTAPVPSPTPTASASPTPSPSASPTPSPSASPTPTPSATPTPTPVPTDPAPGPVDPAPGPVDPAPSGDRGSVAVGDAAYPVPAGAIFVDPRAGSGGNGSQTRPYSTTQAAVNAAKSGATIVLRGGRYHEEVEIPSGKSLTVQAYPNEAVWFDGSSPVTAWTKSGNVWIASGWTAKFSNDIENGQNRRFIDPAHPMAASPDQLFIDGTALRQVATAAQVTPGTFAVDYAGSRLILGSDPSGHDVRASDLSQAFNVISKRTTLQGFGVMRYATPYMERGAVRMQNTEASARDLVVIDNATIGLTISNNNGLAERITAQRNGMLGLGFDLNYNLVLRDSVVTGNNSEFFKDEPVAGGVKITRSRDVTVVNNDISANNAYGLWFDQSNYDMKVIGNTTNDNRKVNIELEISDTGIVAGNQARGAEIGILIYNTSNVRVYNNEVGGSTLMGVKLAQDARRPTSPGAVGINPRIGQDPNMRWLTQNVTVSNNVFAPGGQFSLYARDGETNRAVDTWNVVVTGNLFTDKAAGGPTMVAWGRGDNRTFEAYNTPAALAAAKNSAWVNALTAGAPGFEAIAPEVAKAAATAVPLPADIAALLGVGAGTKVVGIP